MLRSFAPFLLAPLLAGCGSLPEISRGAGPVVRSDPSYHTTLQLQYLGTAGFVIRFGDRVILTAPFYSNPSLLEVGCLPLYPNIQAIERLHPPLGVGEVQAILIGHAHYDHLLDIPYIHHRFHPRSTIFGSDTVRSLLLAGESPIPPGQVLSVMDHLATPEGAPAGWITLPDGEIRILPILAAHSPHACGCKFFGGSVEEPPAEPPRRAGDWKEGTTIAFLIDFFNRKGEIAFRLYFSDSAADSPAGFPPPLEEGGKQRKIDVAILCVGGFTETKDYPRALVSQIKPDTVVLGHWEDFFSLPVENLTEVIAPRRPFGGATGEFIGEVHEGYREAKVILPMPGRIYIFR